MSTAVSGGTLVPGAACVPARYGLLTVAEVDDRAETEGHWEMGFRQIVESCSGVLVLSNDCSGVSENKADSIDDGYLTRDGDPFTLIAGYHCSVGGSLPLSGAWDLAETRLSQGEARAVERTFWTGLDGIGTAIRGGLGSAGAAAINVTPTSDAVSLTDGVALLEEWAGENMSCAPIIHANRAVATYLAERQLVEPSGQVMYMKGTGSRVAVGGGYLGTGPNAVANATGEAWLFASGAVKVLRSPMFHTPPRGEDAAAVDRILNDVTVFAERTYGFTRDCGLAAVKVALGSCCPLPVG